MTDQKTPEELKDDDLDAAQGGGHETREYISFKTGKTTDALRRGDGEKSYIGETEKGIILYEESETI